MTPGKWKQVKELFGAVLDKDTQARAEYLRDACGLDQELRIEIEALLASYDAERTEIDSAPPRSSNAPGTPGDRIGPYEIVKKIGAGGMGVVYLAVRADEAYTKKVAIKVVQATVVGGQEMLERFRHERRILATLDHPNIAKLLDGGATAQGLPYFAMDYVEGERIDQYCEKGQLSISERLKLFREVCSAVQYVHQNLVIHRDLKPGNILVTAEGVPKLLDFGIAKLLGPVTPGDLTQADARPMTPAYASPEQVRGEPVTTASDVYSLGVILFELLASRSPYNLKKDSSQELVQAICDQDPEQPSAVVARRGSKSAERVARELRGDLDNIVLKAIQKDPQRRYLSAEQLSEDLRRYLEGLPVSARPDTWTYRAGKFVRRHRASVLSAAIVVLSLTAGLVTATWQWRVAQKERANAQQQFNDVRSLANSLLFEFHSAIQRLPGSTPARKLLVQRALTYLGKLSRQARGDLGLERELSEAYLKVGDVQGDPYGAGIGDTKGALESYSAALSISQSLVAAKPGDVEASLYLARSYRSLGQLLPLLGKPSEGVDHLRKALEILEGLKNRNIQTDETDKELANTYQVLGDLKGHSGIQNLGDRAAALDLYQKALATYREAVRVNPANRTATRGIAVVGLRMTDLKMAQGDLKGTLIEYSQALKTLEELSGSDVTNADDLRLVAVGYRKVGGALEELGDQKGALENYTRAASLNERLMKADPDNVQAGMGLAISLRYTGDLLAKMADRTGTLASYQKVLAILEHLAAVQPDDVLVEGRRAEILINVAAMLQRDGRTTEARRMTSDALAITRKLASREDVTPDDLFDYASNFLNCAPNDLRQPATAVEYAKRAVEKSAAKDNAVLDLLARAYYENKNPALAAETEQKALDVLAAESRGSPTARREMESRLAKFRTAANVASQRR